MEGRLAAVAVGEMFRHLDARRIPDYADFRAAFHEPLRIEILTARLSEAQLAKNETRVHELLVELAGICA